LLVNEQLALKDYEGQVWAVGDCAFIKTVAGTQAPPTAQHATREAETVAANIHAEMRGGSRSVFAFEGLGKLGALGHNCAIAEVFGIKISGFLAWLLWRTIYLMKLPGLSTKIRVAGDWLIALLLPPDLAQLSLGQLSGFHEQHFAPGEVVFHEGDLGDFVYVIQEGECEVLRTIEGQEQRLAELKAGDYFGEMAVLAETSRNATIRARTAMNVLLIPKSDFDKLKSNVPAFGEVFSALAKKRTAQ
jgi:NADH dehydrogenase